MSNKILCAANKHTFEICKANGSKQTETRIILGARHFDPLMHQALICIDEYYWSWDKATVVQGFVDVAGNFLTRTEAWIVATEHNQIIRRVGADHLNGGTLFSENLY